MAPVRKQASRSSVKKAAVEEPEQSSESKGSLLAQVTDLMQRSVMFKVGPKLPTVLKNLKEELTEGAKPKSEEKQAEVKPEPAEDTSAEGESNEAEPAEDESKTDGTATDVVPDFEIEKSDASSLFDFLKLRLSGLNGLGLFRTGDEAVQSFLKLKTLEFDGGPKAKRKGNPALERLAANFHDNAAQYIYAFWMLMMMRSFLFRSFFACLPWMFFYQIVSLMLPLQQTAKIPLPLEKIPLNARVAATMVLHGFVLLFFVYEAVVKASWLEWFLYPGMIIGHAYAFRPVDA